MSMGGWAARKALRVIEHVEQGKVKLCTPHKYWVGLILCATDSSRSWKHSSYYHDRRCRFVSTSIT